MLERLKRRRAADHSGRTEAVARAPGGVIDLRRFEGLDEALDAGDIRAAMAVVHATDPGLDATGAARIELQLRHDAFRRAARRDATPSVWPPRSELHLEAPLGLPEVAAADLDADTLVAGVRNHGALVVRGLFDDDVCARLRGSIDRALDNFSAAPHERDPRWHTPLADLSGYPVSPTYRAKGAVTFDGQVAVADTPDVAPFVLEQFRVTGVTDLVRGYLGDEPALTLEKWTLRRVPPSANASWHQDGAFLGPKIHTINLWIALSACGSEASGLDVVARRFDEIVPTGTPGAYFDWDVAPDIVEARRDGSPIVSPEFEPGDAVFFDQFLLHRTGLREGLTKDRYALESWFFTPSSHPGHYSGLLT